MQALAPPGARTAEHHSSAVTSSSSLARASAPPPRIDGQEARHMPSADGDARSHDEHAVDEASRCAPVLRRSLLLPFNTQPWTRHTRVHAVCARAAEPHHRAALRRAASRRLMRRRSPLRSAAANRTQACVRGSRRRPAARAPARPQRPLPVPGRGRADGGRRRAVLLRRTAFEQPMLHKPRVTRRCAARFRGLRLAPPVRAARRRRGGGAGRGRHRVRARSACVSARCACQWALLRKKAPLNRRFSVGAGVRRSACACTAAAAAAPA